MPELYKYAYRIISLDLTPGLTNFEIPIHAERITYAKPTNGPELFVRLQSEGNDPIPFRPLAEIKAEFQRLYITAPATPLTIQLFISSPSDVQFTGRDVNIFGDVKAVSVATYETYAAGLGQLFSRGIERSTVAGVTQYVQLKNPAASPVIVEPLALDVRADQDTLFLLAKWTGDITPVNSLRGLNHAHESPDSHAFYRQGDAAPGANMAAGFQLRTIKNTPIVERIPLFMRLDAGESVLIQASNAGVTVFFANFLWREIPL